MSDPQANQQSDSSGMTFDSAPVKQDTPVDSGMTFDSAPVKQDTPIQNGKPVLSPDDQASQTRQMLISGLTGMPTPNMTAADRMSFEHGKAAGAISVPLVAGATTGMTAISEALPSVLMHTTDGVKALNAWAIKNPFQAVMLYHAVKELLPGAKKAMGIIKASPLPIE
jgi:hypothetical protein